MKKLSQKEGIAVFVALAVAIAFAPAIFNSTTALDQHVVKSVEDSFIQTDAEYFDNSANTILDFQTNDITVGDGAEAEFGDTLYVHYVGALSNGDVFDTSTNAAGPFALTLGNGDVITGWEIGLVGMREGGTRHLVIPPALAYGPNEIKDADGNVIIPTDSTLLFDIVLLKVEKGENNEL